LKAAMAGGRFERSLLGLYALALHAHERAARQADGAEMRRAFLDVVRASRARGPVAALIVALREIGDVIWSGLRERRRRANGQGEWRMETQSSSGGFFAGFGEDVRYALRKVRREPAFFAFAALIIGLGVGANTAVFSVVSPLMLRPLPFDHPDRLVWIANTGTGGLSSVTSRTSNLRDFREMNRTFEAITGYFAFYEYGSFNMVGDGPPERLVGAGVARDFLEVLGVRPLLGRNFVEDEAVDNGKSAAILTYGFWQRRFAGDPAVIGRVLTLNGTPTEVVGVLPQSFDFTSTFVPASHVDFLHGFPISDATDRWGNTMAMIGRLRPGATVESAQADLNGVIARLKEADPSRWGLGAAVSGLHEHVAGKFRTAMLLLAGAAGMVLLVACANLSNLLLARGRRRNREMAERGALGATRRRLLRQLTIESLVLALAGGLAGDAIATVVTGLVANTTAVSIPMLSTVSVDGAALAFTLVVTVVAGLLLGVVPALQATRAKSASALNDASRGTTEGRRGAAVREVLVVSEVALACMLLVGMGLLLRSFTRVLDVNLGFQPEHAMMWQIDAARPFDDQQQRVTFYENLVREIDELPGVEAAGLTDTPPLGRNRGWGIRAKGVAYDEGEYPGVFPRLVDSRYIQAMGIPLLAGRHLTPDDDVDASRVLLLNESAARGLFPGSDAVGEIALLGDDEWQVVGVVADVRHQSLEQESGYEMYLPYGQNTDFGTMSLIVRSRLPQTALVQRVRSTLQEIEPAMPTGDFQRVQAIVDRAVSPRRFILMLIGAFAGTALLLAALGIYAVLSYSVSQRIPEIGIRMALGESAGAVRRRVVVRTLVLATIGIAIGASLAFALARLMRTLLYGIGATDPLTFVGGAGVLMLVAFVAGYLPARRASRTDPVGALRAS
jgi:predicted permease